LPHDRSAINEPEALFYKGTKVLSQNIFNLTKLLNHTKNLTLDYNPIFQQASVGLVIAKPVIFYSTIAFFLGLFFSGLNFWKLRVNQPGLAANPKTTRVYVSLFCIQ
jgi:hypothetical protein